jgi:hypothetical protein
MAGAHALLSTQLELVTQALLDNGVPSPGLLKGVYVAILP